MMKRIRPLIFGEVLFDHFPDGKAVLGGAPFNVAWHLQAFGLSPLMVSRIGNDELGKSVRESMEKWGMDTTGLQTDTLHPTGTVRVSIEDGEPAYEIVGPVAYDFIDSSSLPELDGTWLIYHGTLALRHENSRSALAFLKEKVSQYSFIDVNLRFPWFDRNKTVGMIRGADCVKLSEEELAILFPDGAGLEERLGSLLQLIRDRIVLTMGKRGATVVSAKDGSRESVVPAGKEAVVDTVGAGDAFASVIIAGRLLGWPLRTTLTRAQEFAGAIVGIRGATTSDRGFYADFINAWDPEQS